MVLSRGGMLCLTCIALYLLRAYTVELFYDRLDILVGRHFRGALAGLGVLDLWNGGT